LSKLNQGSTI